MPQLSRVCVRSFRTAWHLALLALSLSATACDRYDLESQLEQFRASHGRGFEQCGGPRRDCADAAYTEIFECLRDHYLRCEKAEASDIRFSAARNDDDASYYYFVVPRESGACEVVVFSEYVYGDGSKDLTRRSCAEARFSESSSCVQADLEVCGAEEEVVTCDVFIPAGPPLGC